MYLSLEFRGAKRNSPWLWGLKQETTQKPSAGGGREFPVPQDQVDIFTGSKHLGGQRISPSSSASEMEAP